MPKYILTWNAGYGDEHNTVEAENIETAEEIAYDWWLDSAETYASYSAKEYSKEEAEELGIE